VRKFGIIGRQQSKDFYLKFQKKLSWDGFWIRGYFFLGVGGLEGAPGSVGQFIFPVVGKTCQID
jgi:hypothetical protein